MPLPNFMIVGATKSGTTSLCHYLCQHPNVAISKPKEPLFFEAEYEKGLDYYARRYFPHVGREKAVGEARTRNFFLPYVPERIRECFPDIKLIVVLRDPVLRAFSEWWMRTCVGHEHRTFRDAIAENQRLLQSERSFAGQAGEQLWRSHLGMNPDYFPLFSAYLEQGYYADHLDRYYQFFPRHQLKIVLFDDLARDAQKQVRSLWDYLGVDPNVTIADWKPQNTAATPEMYQLFRIVRRLRLNRLVPYEWERRLVMRIGPLYGRKAKIDPETRGWLSEHYEPHNRRLENLLDRRLIGWTKAVRVVAS